MTVLIPSDVHANLPALEAVLRAEKHFDACLFLGDLVDYGPHPRECLKLLRRLNPVGVLGNHDNAFINNTDCGCHPSYKQYSVETRQWHRSMLDDSAVQFLHSFPVVNTFALGISQVLLSHASLSGDLTQYIPEAEIEQHISNVN